MYIHKKSLKAIKNKSNYTYVRILIFVLFISDQQNLHNSRSSLYS